MKDKVKMYKIPKRIGRRAPARKEFKSENPEREKGRITKKEVKTQMKNVPRTS